MSFLSALHILHVILVSIVDVEHVCQEPVFWIYLSQSRIRHRFSVFIFNFKHVSHLGLVFLLLILSMCLISGFDISYFSHSQIKINCSFIIYFLQKGLPHSRIFLRSGMYTPRFIVKTRYASSVPQLQDFFWASQEKQKTWQVCYIL